MPEITKIEWNEFLKEYPQTHLLQQSAWGEVKAVFGWHPVWVTVGDVGAQVLFRSLPLGFTLAYIPKGPIGKDWQILWPEIDLACKTRNAVFLKVEQDSWEGAGVDLSDHGFKPSIHAIQPLRTIMIDISGNEEEILKRMKQKTRYNIRLSGKKDIIVKESEDVSSFSNMMDVTGMRDEFGVHSQPYYQKVFNEFHPDGKVTMLIAEYHGKPLAGIMVFASGKRAWYFYGASTNEERNRMPTYLLQWKAMLWAKKQGCTEYDLWGVPDEELETLESEFNNQSKGLWGVYRFKRGFGGELKRADNPYDRVYKPLIYMAYKLLVRN